MHSICVYTLTTTCLPLQLKNLHWTNWLKSKTGIILAVRVSLNLLPFMTSVIVTPLPIYYSKTICTWTQLEVSLQWIRTSSRWYWRSGVSLCMDLQSHAHGGIWLTVWREQGLMNGRLKSLKRTYANCSPDSSFPLLLCVFSSCPSFLPSVYNTVVWWGQYNASDVFCLLSV